MMKKALTMLLVLLLICLTASAENYVYPDRDESVTAFADEEPGQGDWYHRGKSGMIIDEKTGKAYLRFTDIPELMQSRYLLPEGWKYKEGSIAIIAPNGTEYTDIYDAMRELNVIDWGWGDLEWMEAHLVADGDTPELGEKGLSVPVLAAIAAAALVGTGFAYRKVKRG